MVRVLVLAFSGALLSGAAFAQSTESPREAPSSPPQSPPTSLPLPPDQGEGSGSSLSERLSRSQGVIRPPQDVDPAMKADPPPTGPNSTPVVPPPGAPGGDPRLEPK
jgi:hypothetical protein